MKTFAYRFALLMLAATLSAALFPLPLCAKSVRKPLWAGRFYESDPSGLVHHIDALTKKAAQTRITPPEGKFLRAIVMPHAGYTYSGWTAAHAAQAIAKSRYAKVVLIGPDHRIGLRTAAISDAAAYETPLGRIDLHHDITRLRRQKDLFETLPLNRDREHCLEVILPFLQRYLGTFQLVPVVVGSGDVEKLSHALDAIVDDDTLLVVSSDLSHYLPYAEAVERDHETIEEIINLTPDKLMRDDNRACGKTPLLIAIQMARRHRWQPVLLHYSNSGDTAGDRSQVVGYAAIGFFGDRPANAGENQGKPFGDTQGQILIRLARRTIMEKLGMDTSGPAFTDLDADLRDDRFKRQRGTFVTLTIDGRLRGCIGNLTATGDVLNGVRRNALNAAFRDPRFPPLTIAEMNTTRIEVSILTDPQPLDFKNGQDLVEKLRCHVDGVIVRKGLARATFLPQVWEQLPAPEDFLSHLCRKAGLPPDAWKKKGVDILTYQVQYFEENR
ncbi:MAG: AmmeMemoRadiSam system protein B [Deltaproteobacteria bacterium]|nr:AmmeMemoRadiSam system protein B [Deltaproteobacteria bacterium]